MPHLLKLLVGILCTCFTSSRSVSRYGPLGNVNLVEFNIRGTVYGRCTYNDDTGEEVSLVYEEIDNNLLAKSSNPTVVDPTAKARECRTLASQPPNSPNEGRTDLYEDNAPFGSELALYRQFQDFDKKTDDNRDYVSQLQPRFIGKLLKAGVGMGLSMLNSQGSDYSQPSVGITVDGPFLGNNDYGGGNRFSNIIPTIPRIHLVQPANTHDPNQSSQGYGSGGKFPFHLGR